jgi:UDP-glucose 4-epimerase
MNEADTYIEAAQLNNEVITGDVGYIGSPLTGEFLHLGMKATVIEIIKDGIRDVIHAIRTGLICSPHDQRYRNAQFIVQ